MMNIETILASLRAAASENIYLDQRKPGIYQVIIPILHEDNDMIDVYVEESPAGKDMVRICDFGLTLMRLSYTFDIKTDAQNRIFNSILANNGVKNDNGNLYIDSSAESLYRNILQFSGCVQKVCNMRYWSRDVVRSAFYEDLNNCIREMFQEFSPRANPRPFPTIVADWSLSHNDKGLYLFGINTNDKAKTTVIALLSLKLEKHPSFTVVVHEDINKNKVRKKERSHISKYANKEYDKIDDFKKDGLEDTRQLLH